MIMALSVNPLDIMKLVSWFQCHTLQRTMQKLCVQSSWPKQSVCLFTCFCVEHDLVFKLFALLQGLVNAQNDTFTGLMPIQELTGTALLHDLSPREACEFTEAIRAVDNRKAFGHLSIGQDEVAVCKRKEARWHENI